MRDITYGDHPVYGSTAHCGAQGVGRYQRPVVMLDSPDEQDVSGQTLEEALGWCLVWLMAPFLG